MKAQKSFDPHPEAQAFAETVRSVASTQVTKFEVTGRAQKLAWEARMRAVNAGRRQEAARWLEALAVLGHKGALQGVQEAAEQSAAVDAVAQDSDTAGVTA